MNIWKNEIIYCGKYSKLVITNGIKTTIVLISNKDVEIISKVRWRLTTNGYIVGSVNSKQIYLHRYIMGPKQNEVVDHINRNTLDNRRTNLRNTNQSINISNTGVRTNNTSGVKNLWFSNKTKYWRGEFNFNKKSYRTSRYKYKEKAIAALERLKEKVGYEY